MKYTFFILLFILFSTSATSGSGSGHRFVPFFFTYSPKVLSKHLTTGIGDDSTKVASIHYWITHHIRYDVKKFLNYNFAHVPVKKVLRRRRAICMGYVDLFNELCKNAGIKSVGVPGYVKSEEVDIVDTFYLADHIWNAVLLRGQWRPIDVTWDAGYVIESMRKHLIRKRPPVYRPRFIREPSDRYFMIASELFVLDHLPMNKHWQLMDTVMSVEAFARDSSAYYKRHYIDSLYSRQGRDIAYGLQYIAMDEDDRDIEDGEQSYAFNHRNHLEIADAWRIRTAQVMKKMKEKNVDTLQELSLCDTAQIKVDKAILHYDSNVTMITQERTQRLAFNDQKREVFNSYSMPMLLASHRSMEKLRIGIVRSKNAAQSYKNAIRINNKRELNMQKDVSFWKTKEAKKNILADSMSACESIKKRQDTLGMQQTKLASDSADLDSLYRTSLQRTNRYTAGVYVTRGYMIGDIYTRFDFFDDFDYEIKRDVPTMTQHKRSTDSNLYVGQQLFLDTLYHSVRRYREDLRNLYGSYRAMSFDIKRLKRACTYDKAISDMHQANRDMMTAYLSRSNNVFGQCIGRALSLRSYCRSQRRSTRRELFLIGFDRALEHFNSSMRIHRIGRKASAYIRFSNGQKTLATRLQRQIDKHRRKFTRI